jgi:hypothetical protein
MRPMPEKKGESNNPNRRAKKPPRFVAYRFAVFRVVSHTRAAFEGPHAGA